MKVKVIPFGLILITFLFCLINHTHALRDPWWENRNSGEHPWQESDSPPVGDTITPNGSSTLWIIAVPTKIIIIRTSVIKPDIKIPGGAANRIDFKYSTK